MTPGPNLAFFVAPKPKKKGSKQPPCRVCHATIEPGNLVMTIDFIVSSGVEVTGYYHWRCVQNRADEAGINADETYHKIRNTLLEGGDLFPSKD